MNSKKILAEVKEPENGFYRKVPQVPRKYFKTTERQLFLSQREQA